MQRAAQCMDMHCWQHIVQHGGSAPCVMSVCGVGFETVSCSAFDHPGADTGVT
jgi:hypothetical protein